MDIVGRNITLLFKYAELILYSLYTAKQKTTNPFPTQEYGQIQIRFVHSQI